MEGNFNFVSDLLVSAQMIAAVVVPQFVIHKITK